jgi:hypothetical protein
MRISLVVFFVLAFFVFAAGAQNSTTALVVRIVPEAHVNPPQATLSFVVSADGTGDVTTQTVGVSAWVRAMRGHPIRLTANQTGSLPVTWAGTSTQATAGGRQATCIDGNFAGNSTQDLAANWQNSGTLQCLIRFSLADPRSLAPGVYKATLTFAAQ